MECTLIDLGLTRYDQAYTFQKSCLEEVKFGSVDGVLILTEHKPVFTFGRFAKPENLLVSEDFLKEEGVDLANVERGGDITFHGPGQLVVYPIINLAKHKKDIHKFMRDLEEVVMRTLQDFSIKSFRIKGRTGVWTKKGKIASLGIAASRWITYHGLALNVSTDLKYFGMINPCGFKDINVTSVKDILGSIEDADSLKEKFMSHFCDIFNINIAQLQNRPSFKIPCW
ncbi:lipoyl(octanoyl) transferase LipB [Candidatus Omnitrophota bacterium]